MKFMENLTFYFVFFLLSIYVAFFIVNIVYRPSYTVAYLRKLNVAQIALHCFAFLIFIGAIIRLVNS